ncbi:MAG: hypothetical protein GVY02_06955 [Bacteroidetes bacterium]|jgi:hypothetical protein|nr:hypothetical protein [Bacteroidota bacterium]
MDQGKAASPDVPPQSNGHLEFDLRSDWTDADAFRLTATDPHGREIYTWSWPISQLMKWVAETVSGQDARHQVRETSGHFVLTSGEMEVQIDKSTGLINRIQIEGKTISLNGGPDIVGGESDLKEIYMENNVVKAFFSGEEYDAAYSITEDEWLKIEYNYQPQGERPYFGVTFSYPEEQVNGIRWAGNGPYRVWKNRLAGVEYGVWEKQYNDAITGYRWDYPEFKGYHSRLNWAVLDTDEGPITMMVTDPRIYFGLFQPAMPPDPANTRFQYPEGDISFLHAISPIGTKFREPEKLGPDSRPNLFQYSNASQAHDYQNTLWLYFGRNE